MWNPGRVMTLVGCALLFVAVFLPWAGGGNLGISMAIDALDRAGGLGDTTPFVVMFIMISVGAIGGLVGLIATLLNKVWLGRIFILLPLLSWVGFIIYTLAETGEFRMLTNLDVGNQFGMVLTWLAILFSSVVCWMWKKPEAAPAPAPAPAPAAPVA